MSDRPAYRPSPAPPRAASSDPDWTTGQGIGFLVALPGWIMVGVAVLAALVGAFGPSDDVEFVQIMLGVLVVGGPVLLSSRLGQVLGVGWLVGDLGFEHGEDDVAAAAGDADHGGVVAFAF